MSIIIGCSMKKTEYRSSAEGEKRRAKIIERERRNKAVPIEHLD
jgi:hypothetical protein